MTRLLLLLLFVGLASTDEHWFVFDQHQFPGFNTPLFTLISSGNNTAERNLSFILSTYERSINIDIHIGNSTIQSVKLNIERADLLYNTLNHLIFIAIRQQTRFETYVNCKLIDSYVLYSSDDHQDENSSLKIDNLTQGIQHFQSATDEHYQQKIFDQFNCKQTSTIMTNDNKTTTIGKSLIRKMQNVIEKAQRRKQRLRRHQNQQLTSSDSITIIYKPNIDQLTNPESNFRTILNVSQLSFHIRYYPNEHLFYIQFNHENRTQFLLYADKSTDHRNPSPSIVLFLHITPLMISCYVNCELTDQEFIVDSLYVQNLIRTTMDHQQQWMEYDQRSTLVLFNGSIEQTAANFFCLKLEKKMKIYYRRNTRYGKLIRSFREEFHFYLSRKFANALDMLVNSLDVPTNHHNDPSTTTPMTTTIHSISAVNIHTINGFGSLIAPSYPTDANTMTSEIIEYDRICLSDQDCSSNNSLLKCQSSRCTCPTRYFWSPILRRCISCKDLSIGNRCFRLSSHKSTWYEANDYCQDENSLQDEHEYTMKLASNLNRTDIQLLKQSLVHDDDGEQLDYFYWIGSTSHFDTRKLHQQNTRNKRQVPTTIFRWYDNGETAQLNMPDIWCTQKDHPNLGPGNNNELCVSLTSCGLYADDCQRNYRFLCEAV